MFLQVSVFPQEGGMYPSMNRFVDWPAEAFLWASIMQTTYFKSAFVKNTLQTAGELEN